MSGPATYGELMDRAAWAVARGVAQVQHEPFPDARQAYASVADYYEVLRAVEAHVWTVLDPHRVPGTSARADADPREVAAVRLVEELRPVTAPRRGLPEPGGSASPWVDARRFVRAATDLLATHREYTGAAARSPEAEAVLEDPAARGAALARAGEITAALLEVRGDLQLRAVQVLGATKRAAAILPETAGVAQRARQVAGEPTAASHAGLDALTVADPGVVAGSPGREVAERMLRLRRAGWAAAQEGHPPVGTVRSLATVSLVVHVHALAQRGYPPNGVREVAVGDRAAAAMVERARGWAQVGRETYTWRTASRPDAQVMADVRAVTGLLRRWIPLTGPGPDVEATVRAELRQVLEGAVAITSDLASYTARAVGVMAAREQVHVPGRSLSGDQVSDHPELVSAKLTGRLAPAPLPALEQVRDVLGRLAERPATGLGAGGGLTLRTAPPTAQPTPAGVEPIHRDPS